MTETEIEKDAQECWAVWRREFMKAGRNPSKFSENQVWSYAYRAGVELGKELEREECAKTAEGFKQPNVAQGIRMRKEK